ncbi:Isochorismatase-like protein [Diplogelasinospora grovesii]|uniref:nicotinamidase n=1 Tax=Diplogelasinospora grovesii TaxID=303347 RepID=A0AAN6N1M5_9PEZI|nr:Isochorismatase-like protein [Diplogelasinospora grovesii]
MAEKKPVIFKPALLVVDMQEDFCPPNGSLAVAGGRDIVAAINHLLKLPFALKVATKDWHKPDHVSFAVNHPLPDTNTTPSSYATNNGTSTPQSHPKQTKQPFVDTCIIRHPDDPSQSYETRLWPVHCVQDSPGAQLIPELDHQSIHMVHQKGTDSRVEMYSAFYDPLRVYDSKLADVLRMRGITHVYVVGLAADYCVKFTALDSQAEGFTTYIIDECTEAVDPDYWETQGKAEVQAAGVKIISVTGPEVKRVVDDSGNTE